MSTIIQNRHRSSLVHHQQQKKRRVDFVTELPYDIIPFIMKHFETMELFHLFQISKEWKTQLISCKSLWSKVIIHGDTIDRVEEHNNDPIVSFVATVADNIIRLELISIRSKKNVTPMILKQIVFGSFTRLEYLELSECRIQMEESEIIYQTLDAVSNTLLYLKMVAISPKPTSLYFEKVLAICHHLKGFWCDSSVILFPRRSQIAATTVPSKLKQLVLNVNPVHDSDIDRMAQLCPNIRRLYINVYFHTAIDKILQHYENELEYLNINMYLCLVTTPPSSIWSPFENKYNHNCIRQQPLLDSNNQSATRGLRYLALRKFNETTLISLLHRHAQTLEELYLYYNNNNETLSVQEFQNTNNTNMLFSNLRVLNVSSSNDSTFILTTLLTHVSRTTLQNLHIGSCNLSNHPMILTSIKELENLKYLHLNHSIYANREDVIQLLRHFVTKSRQYHDSFSTCEQQQPSLKSFLISGTYFQLINDKVLQEIGKIETLERIIIHDATKVTEQGLTSFCQMLKKYNNRYLRFLELNHVPVATFKTLEHLLFIPTLKTLILRNVANDHIKKEDFVGFFERGINVIIYYL